MSAQRRAIRDASRETLVGSYADFLARKQQHGSEHGFEPKWMPDFLFPFQKTLTDWAIRKGRAAIFADCGLGKTPMQLVWAQNVIQETNRNVLILTPLAVAGQTIHEAEKFDVDCQRTSGDIEIEKRVYVTNYEKLHKFDPSDFAGVVCDESSAIKAMDGKRRAAVTEFLRTVPYRLLCTATAAPNDYVELGTSSEALGELGQMDMLSQFFIDKTTSGQSYGGTKNMYGYSRGPKHRFKGHAEQQFWKWVCSWARACRKPSDLGFDDNGFLLPPLVEREHVLETAVRFDGMLFAVPARDMQEEREERRRTIQERCEMAAELVADTKKPAVIWCHYNAEGDLLEKLIPDGKQVAGKHTDDQKEETYEAFSGGDLRVIITKPKIGAFGLNWQHCSHIVTFASHSYEQYYQAVRRCWRFGQENKVVVDLVATEGEKGIKENLRRKSDAADKMFVELVAHMNDAMRLYRGKDYAAEVEVPKWL